MRDDTPTVYVLAGPPGPGKTAYATALVDRGVLRLEATAGTMTDETESSLVTQLRAGHDVLIDYAEADADERERCKRLVELNGGQWYLINFTTDHTTLVGRLNEGALVTDHG